MTGGWHAQLDRVRRWYHRASEAEDPTDRYDFLYAFIENAFHLRDWLKDTGAVSEEDLDRFFTMNAEMRLCRDLANSHKHYSLRNPSQPTAPSEAYEYRPGCGNLAPDVSLVILSDGTKHDAIDLAKRILDAWEEFIACHRRCCICHRFCGVKIELDHICPRADGGADQIDNAIPVCFECHAEIHLYNDQHPRGRRFRPEELRAHKEQWLRICRESPNLLFDPLGTQEVGPMQSLIDELMFNSEIASRMDDETIGALFLVSQFSRSIEQGIFSLLPDLLRAQICATYATLMQANMYLRKMATLPWGGSGSAWYQAYSFASKAVTRAQSEVPTALEALLSYLGHDKDPT